MRWSHAAPAARRRSRPCTATEAPATLGRQVLWALAILSRSPALRVRAGAVTRALVDGALPREAAPAAALSKWSVARIAGAVAVSAAAAAGDAAVGAAAEDPATYNHACSCVAESCDPMSRYREYAQRYIDLAGTQDALYIPHPHPPAKALTLNP